MVVKSSQARLTKDLYSGYETMSKQIKILIYLLRVVLIVYTAVLK